MNVRKLKRLTHFRKHRILQLLRYMRDLEISIPHLNDLKEQQIHVPFGRSIYTCKLTHILKASEKNP